MGGLRSSARRGGSRHISSAVPKYVTLLLRQRPAESSNLGLVSIFHLTTKRTVTAEAWQPDQLRRSRVMGAGTTVAIRGERALAIRPTFSDTCDDPVLNFAYLRFQW